MSSYRVSMHRVTEIEIGSVGTYGFDFDITSTSGGENSYETFDIFNAACGETSEELRATRKLLMNLQSLQLLLHFALNHQIPPLFYHSPLLLTL